MENQRTPEPVEEQPAAEPEATTANEETGGYLEGDTAGREESGREQAGYLEGDTAGREQPLGDSLDLSPSFAGGAQDLPPDGETLI